MLWWPDMRRSRFVLDATDFSFADATVNRRFVSQMTLRRGEQALEIITPPEKGSIAPRAAALPVVAESAAVVSCEVWATVRDWLECSGRLCGRTVAEIARFARIASPVFAIALGEAAARRACEMVWEQGGPMRHTSHLRYPLMPLEDAAARSSQAADAFIAALAYIADLDPY